MPLLSGNTVFGGDSITVGLPPFVKVDGTKLQVAKGGMPATWLLSALRDADANGQLRGQQNFVVLIGTNDIGGGRSVNDIVGTIRSIWALAKARGLRVLAMTIPPCRGYAGFASNFDAVNARRHQINAALAQAQSQGEADVLLNLDAVLGDPSDQDKLASSADSGDHLHPRKDVMGALITPLLGAVQGGPAAVQPGLLSQFPGQEVAGSGETLLWVMALGLGATATYLLTRKRRFW